MQTAFTGGTSCRRVACLALAALGLLAMQPARADAPWSLRLPKEEAVVYRGVVSFDSAGTGGAGMLYPAPSAAGLIAAVITHGLLVESQKNSQKEQLQSAADKVLLPYRAVLDGFKHQELMDKALQRTAWGKGKVVPPGSAEGAHGWVMESLPVFAMTQDQRALVLDSHLTLYRPGESGKAAYQATIRVISQPRLEQDLETFWKDSEAAALKDESANLLAHSLQLALQDASEAAATAPPLFKTVRYREGETEKMERAQLVAHRCDRQVIRTLRGWLMSVPAAPASASVAEPCEPALPGWK